MPAMSEGFEGVASVHPAFVGGYALGYMLHPDDEKARAHHETRLLATVCSEAGSAPDDDLLKRIVQALGAVGDPYANVLAGCVAGDVLLSALSSDDVGVNEAVFLVSELYLRRFRQRDGEAMGATSERSVQRFWQKMRPVAHWWAAYLVLLRNYEEASAALGRQCTVEGAVLSTYCDPNFAAVAHGFFELAIARRLPRRSETLLERESCWFMKGAPTMPLVSGRFTETERGILARYRPR